MFNVLAQKFSSIFSKISGRDKLTESNIEETLGKIHDVLLEADVPYDVVKTFIEQTKKEVVGQKIFASLKPSEQLMQIVHNKLIEFLGGKTGDIQFAFQIPSVVMVMGLQGAGKTTTIAKLVRFVQDAAQKKGKKRRILVASVDFYRPAAIDQLEILAGQVGASFYRSAMTEPVLAAQDILKFYKEEAFEILFLDTAGRLHVDDKMIKELKDIDALINPRYKFLIVDSMTGQESLKVAQEFNQNIGFNGIILTKMDSDTRGGIAFAFKYVLNKPILFTTIGEKVQDLEFFRPERVANRIIGLGDLATLVEKAKNTIKQSEQKNMEQSLLQGRISLQDFAQQMEMVGKLGSLTNLVKYLPGAGGLNVSNDMIEKGEKEIKKFKAIISSMTKKERVYPKILDASRKKRIASGSGVTVADVNLLLNRFEQSQQFVKIFSRMNKK